MDTRLTFSASARKVGVIGSILPLLWACDSPSGAISEPGSTGPIVAMQVTAGNPSIPAGVLGGPFVVTIDERGNASGELALKPDYFPEDPTPITVGFLDPGGATVRPPFGSEWRVIPSDSARVRFQRLGPFRGGIERIVVGSTRLTVALVRASDNATLFGPFALSVNVTEVQRP